MKYSKHIKDRQDNNFLENLGIALVLGVMGFFTGILIWFVTPVAFGISAKVYFSISVILAVIFFVFGLIHPLKTVDSMGNSWDFLLVLRRQVFSWIKLIK